MFFSGTEGEEERVKSDIALLRETKKAANIIISHHL